MKTSYSLYLEDFKDFSSPLYGAIIEAGTILQNYKGLFDEVRIYAYTGKCIKVVR